MLGFFATFTAVMGLLHAYIWRRLVRDTALPSRARRFATAVVLGLFVSLPATLGLMRFGGPDRAVWPGFVGFTWLGVMFYVVVFLLVFDAARLTLALRRRLARSTEPAADANAARPADADASTPNASPAQTPVHIQQAHARPVSRRVFLARTGAVTTLASSSLVSAYGLYSGLGEIETPEVVVKLPRLPKQLDGFRIVQLSDVHIGDMLGARFLRSVVDQANAQRPDLVAITGDLVDGSVPGIGTAVAELAKLRSRYGTFFVTGNHEYYSGAAAWIAFLRSLGITVLSNERVPIGDAASFDLIGVPDHHARPERPDMQRAAVGRDESRELIVLAHQPVQVRDAVTIGAGLQISGHTHGGQLFPFNVLTGLVQPHLAGLERAGGHTQIYTSRGTGFWGPPMRVLAPAEITSIVLTG